MNPPLTKAQAVAAAATAQRRYIQLLKEVSLDDPKAKAAGDRAEETFDTAIDLGAMPDEIWAAAALLD